ncbi:MAG: glycoside hydrolase 100 family protein [Gammaproteobacteria bacterium]|nr:glycoside hydrolase 100 family protein [Gammaproteobacteria bacterium]MDH5653870.1 glycoside hydrolase 100 family protein [Gammaproteobacteria bacterium]
MKTKQNSLNTATTTALHTEGYQRAEQLLGECSNPDGFLAAASEHDNYRRIWARDGVIVGLAALMSGNEALVRTLRATLTTLARYQGPHGEIPSNVDTGTQRISYGGTTGRVDADLWFIIGCGEYWRATGDHAFLENIIPAVEKTRFLLGAWEYNNRGLLYVPAAGDWADEYLHAGYILYDQLLYLQAQRTLAVLHEYIHGSCDHQLLEKQTHLKHLIQSNYWFHNDDEMPDDVYHEVLFKKGLMAAPHCRGEYWLPFFSPTGYGYRFDSFANILVSLFGVAGTEQQNRVDAYIETILHPELPLLPAFHPVIQPVDEDWKHLQMTFSYTFKNKPYEFHNGGLWPMLSGFYVADLAKRGKLAQAEISLQAIHEANRKARDGEEWEFAEYIHGQNLQAGGTKQQAWSAAAAIMATAALNNKKVFNIDGD